MNLCVCGNQESIFLLIRKKEAYVYMTCFFVESGEWDICDEGGIGGEDEIGRKRQKRMV